ncbi:hypothetical protein [Alkalicoccus saliphilus]|uniref:Uncharacterized protein n=1 Tax=Alkalicoccus saliphilus TaxID=200989 RepID=A0A2T4U3Z9_9BACI|nr:hypothetical protein [Alkalicoccus saliphilus]PTL38116.1 hypothetical protein C6Y45_13050 [Alkalicoccus saliphilus]
MMMEKKDKKKTVKLTTDEYNNYQRLQKEMELAGTPIQVKLYSQEIQMLIREAQARQRKKTKSMITMTTKDPKESWKLTVEEYNEYERLNQLMEFADTPWGVKLYSREIQTLFRETKARQRKEEESST